MDICMCVCVGECVCVCKYLVQGKHTFYLTEMFPLEKKNMWQWGRWDPIKSLLQTHADVSCSLCDSHCSAPGVVGVFPLMAFPKLQRNWELPCGLCDCGGTGAGWGEELTGKP